MSAHKTVIDLDNTVQRLRYTCPRGHRSWEPTNYHYYCKQCASAHEDVDPAFDELHDQKTGATLARDEVELMTEMGSYKDCYKGQSA